MCMNEILSRINNINGVEIETVLQHFLLLILLSINKIILRYYQRDEYMYRVNALISDKLRIFFPLPIKIICLCVYPVRRQKYS